MKPTLLCFGSSGTVRARSSKIYSRTGTHCWLDKDVKNLSYLLLLLNFSRSSHVSNKELDSLLVERA